MHIGDVIKKYRHDHGRMSLQAFADKCGLSKGYIAMLERNKNSKTGEPIVPSVETFLKVSKAMNMSLNELADVVDENQPIALTNDDFVKEKSNSKAYDFESCITVPCMVAESAVAYNTHPSAVKIPVLGRVVAGMPISAYQDVIDYEEITREMAESGEFYALRVRGQSMEPRICEGDTVIIKVQPDVESGDIAVVLVNGDEATLKQVYKSDAGITLVAFNPAVYEPKFYTNKQIKALPVIISGKMVEFRARY